MFYSLQVILSNHLRSEASSHRLLSHFVKLSTFLPIRSLSVTCIRQRLSFKLHLPSVSLLRASLSTYRRFFFSCRASELKEMRYSGCLCSEPLPRSLSTTWITNSLQLMCKLVDLELQKKETLTVSVVFCHAVPPSWSDSVLRANWKKTKVFFYGSVKFWKQLYP